MDELTLRRWIVFGAALVYWAGVVVQIRRVRRRIGRSPNVEPRGVRERWLWLGWMLVVVVWVGQPWVAASGVRWAGWQPIPALVGPLGFITGLVLVGAGYAGTLWCYASMGEAWRMGVKRAEKTRLVTGGLYGRVRHPIYLLQILMLGGSAALHPSPLSFGILGLHLVCVWIKAADEEAHLLRVHGEAYRAYRARTGRLWPRWGGASSR